MRRLTLVSDNPRNTGAHPSGTTIQFEIGLLKNPASLKSSGYFYIAIVDISLGSRYVLNQSINQISVTNTEPGPIKVTEIIQSNDELGGETELKVSFESQSVIPQSSSFSITLPQNVQVSQTTQMKINGYSVNASVN